MDVFSQKGAWLGAGFYSETSKIGVRILSDNANESFGPEFFERRVRYALEYRRTVMDDLGCCRLIFGEADGLPGLTVDKFSGILVAQALSFGTDKVKDTIYRALCRQLEAMGERINGVYERNEAALRELEGLPKHKGWYEGLPHPESTVTEIVENGVRYSVDFENGQKTGFFLDQKLNRLAVAKLARGRRVLDCFTHTGSFALNAALHGAEHVTAVDVSESAVAMARKNAELNGLEPKMSFLAADVFELLPRLCEEKAKYDLVILDPPAFTKSRRTIRPRSEATGRLTTAQCACCRAEATSPPAPARISWTPPILNICCITLQKMQMSNCARWKSESRRRTIPCSGTCRKPPTSSSISSRLSRLLCNAHKKGIGKFAFI